jgi:hypothetical protein
VHGIAVHLFGLAKELIDYQTLGETAPNPWDRYNYPLQLVKEFLFLELQISKSLKAPRPLRANGAKGE